MLIKNSRMSETSSYNAVVFAGNKSRGFGSSASLTKTSVIGSQVL